MAEENDSLEAIRNHIDLILLSLLNEKERYGYEICKEVASRTNNVCEMNEQTLYSALRRLEKENAIEAFFSSEQKIGKRKYYRLTSVGKTMHRMLSIAWMAEKQVIDRILYAGHSK